MGDLGDGVPTEMIGDGETQRLDTNRLYDLIEQTEGTATAQRVLASGTPRQGLPQLVDDEPAPRDTRVRDVMLGGAISLVAMIAWFCATQL